jgi:hypothetical protein
MRPRLLAPSASKDYRVEQQSSGEILGISFVDPRSANPPTRRPSMPCLLPAEVVNDLASSTDWRRLTTLKFPLTTFLSLPVMEKKRGRRKEERE